MNGGPARRCVLHTALSACACRRTRHKRPHRAPQGAVRPVRNADAYCVSPSNCCHSQPAATEPLPGQVPGLQQLAFASLDPISPCILDGPPPPVTRPHSPARPPLPPTHAAPRRQGHPPRASRRGSVLLGLLGPHQLQLQQPVRVEQQRGGAVRQPRRREGPLRRRDPRRLLAARAPQEVAQVARGGTALLLLLAEVALHNLRRVVLEAGAAPPGLRQPGRARA
jgi:hypothetical protein